MTRETKAGIVVSCAFLGLAGTVLWHRMGDSKEQTDPDDTTPVHVADGTPRGEDGGAPKELSPETKKAGVNGWEESEHPEEKTISGAPRPPVLTPPTLPVVEPPAKVPVPVPPVVDPAAKVPVPVPPVVDPAAKVPVPVPPVVDPTAKVPVPVPPVVDPAAKVPVPVPPVVDPAAKVPVPVPPVVDPAAKVPVPVPPVVDPTAKVPVPPVVDPAAKVPVPLPPVVDPAAKVTPPIPPVVDPPAKVPVDSPRSADHVPDDGHSHWTPKAPAPPAVSDVRTVSGEEPSKPFPAPVAPVPRITVPVLTSAVPPSRVDVQEVRRIKIQSGDTSFEMIAGREYGGHAEYGPALRDFNQKDDFASAKLKSGELVPGDSIVIPPVEKLKPAANRGGPADTPAVIPPMPPVAPAVPAPLPKVPQAAYKVVAPGGESLYEIGKALLHDENGWMKIQTLNPGLDPVQLVPVNKVLILPEGTGVPQANLP